MAKEIKLPTADELKTKVAKFTAKVSRRHLEINLVPDIKDDMIKSLKLRNFTFFVCIVIASASVAAILVFSSIVGGQQAIIGAKNGDIEALSAKINEYDDLDNFLTIKNQLSGLSEISDNKNILSRIFNVLTAIIPKGNNTIQISELSIDLTSSPVVISFDAQANAGDPPYYDYLVLDSFQKSMDYMRYDYGRYVDRNDVEIPAYCMIETGADGSNFKDAEKGIYALWLINGEGCNPSYEPEYDEDNNITNAADATKGYEDYMTTYEGQTVVKVWRTPQFTDWYQEDPSEDSAYISLDGYISNVAHFSSDCINYSGISNYQNSGNPSETVYANSDGLTWVGVNNCKLVDTSENDGIVVPDDHSNGRGADGELVLRFSAAIYLDPEIFSFNNKHLIALGPSSRYNVTDSYVQIQKMFTQAAAACADNDTACKNNQKGGN